MNFQAAFRAGQIGMNKGLPTGIPALDREVYGVQRKAIYCFAAPPKAGKTALVDFLFVLMPFLLAPDEDVEIIYYSYEIDRIKKEFKFAAFFFFYDYSINTFQYRGHTYKMSAEYLLGKYQDHEKLPILVSDEHKAMLAEIYTRRIVPLFGEYDETGKKITNGRIMFIEEKDNPTGMRNYVMNYARHHGRFTEESYQTTDEDKKFVMKKRINGYIPNHSSKRVIVITDHIRKLKRERGFTMKENIDKWVEYQVELRNWCGYTFANIVHLNRNLTTPERLKNNIEFLYPTGDDIKDSGNISEEADFVYTMFNPNEEKYGIKKHFGTVLVEEDESTPYPDYRSLHLVESRDTESPMHFKINFKGNVSFFSEFHEEGIGYGSVGL